MEMQEQYPSNQHERLLVQELRRINDSIQELTKLLSKQEEKPKKRVVKKNETDSTREEGK